MSKTEFLLRLIRWLVCLLSDVVASPKHILCGTSWMRDDNQCKVSYPWTLVGSFQRGCKPFYCGLLATCYDCQAILQNPICPISYIPSWGPSGGRETRSVLYLVSGSKSSPQSSFSSLPQSDFWLGFLSRQLRAVIGKWRWLRDGFSGSASGMLISKLKSSSSGSGTKGDDSTEKLHGTGLSDR